MAAAVVMLSAVMPVGAEGFFRDIEYQVNAGFNVGGASPLPLPEEIRRIKSFDPKLNMQVGAIATKWLTPDRKWGLTVALQLGTKGMETKARVKNYGMEILDDGKKLKGRWQPALLPDQLPPPGGV